MDPREFVETRTKRYMAQALEELERKLEQPLTELLDRAMTPGPDGALPKLDAHELRAIVADIDPVKRTFRKKLQTLASDCLDLMPSDMQINAFEPVRR